MRLKHRILDGRCLIKELEPESRDIGMCRERCLIQYLDVSCGVESRDVVLGCDRDPQRAPRRGRF